MHNWTSFRGQDVTPEQDCCRLICLSNICSICRMKAISFLRSWLEISVYPPCLSLPAPNLHKDQRYRRHLQLPVWLTRPGAARGTGCHRSWNFRTLHQVFHMDLRGGGLNTLQTCLVRVKSHNEITSGGKLKSCGVKIRSQKTTGEVKQTFDGVASRVWLVISLLQ